MATIERYTHGHHDSVLRTHSWRTVENSAAYLVPHLVPGASVLDVGSGPGTITVDIGRRVAGGRVVGIDSAEDVRDQAQALADDNGLTNVEFQVGDAYHLDFPDDTFDVVHAHQVLQHVADPVAVLREMRRVTKPGGVVAARDVIYGGAVWHPLLPGLRKWMDVYQAVARFNGGDPDGGSSLKAWAMEAGFEDISTGASIWCFADDADREWWGGNWAVRALESSFAPQSIEAGAATLEDLQEVSEAWKAWVADKTGWFAMPHGEILATK
ncbi:methyltransferase domain-containing protein [Okibacterium fritillariae]|uniref:Ubiquinone/menaquinone biosynthesis C-methylase UbiE n=1 Tax=Okibacterium fritillariae TaxID=123320 RepID=A0A1T5JA40_9MICO|nr:methyltransferase domain-containing protein [Okibacterium fritillariae]SKC48214.1 Ubiquinone/menaquinone biosynthesis C-methylase UbiE [Okibacterium fritillariae]